MCTSCVWADNGVATVTGRNMDWFEDMESDLWVFPAGMERVGLSEKEDPNPLKWTSKYGSVITSIYGITSGDGMNEKGLTGHVLWLAEATYQPRDTSVPGMSASFWMQYFLDQYATVAEAVAGLEANPFQVVRADLLGRPATVHLQLSDASGDVAVLELLEDGLKVHHGDQYPVLTNSPIFSQQLEHMKQYSGFGGDLPLPGTTQAADRFVRAWYYHNHLPKPTDLNETIARILGVMRSSAQPFTMDDPNDPSNSATIWRTVSDQTNLVYFFEPTDRPFLVWLDFSNLDFSVGAPVKRLILSDMSMHVGEQSAKLVEQEAFEFALPGHALSEARPLKGAVTE